MEEAPDGSCKNLQALLLSNKISVYLTIFYAHILTPNFFFLISSMKTDIVHVLG